MSFSKGKEVPLLKKELIGEIHSIDDPRNYTSEQILQSYFREILIIARKYVRPSVDFEDLVVEGLIGLLDAIGRWDPEKSTGPHSFRQLAIVRIKNHMFEYFLTNRTPYTIPIYMSRAMNLVEQIASSIRSHEYPGNPEEDLRSRRTSEAFVNRVPKELGERVESLKIRLENLARNTGRTYEQMVIQVLKIKEDLENYDDAEGEIDISPEEVATQKQWLETFLQSMKSDVRKILELRIHRGLSLEEIGEIRGITRERVRQIIEEAVGHFQKTRVYREAAEQDA